MADDVDKMNLAFDRVLEFFKLKNLKDSQRDALEKLVGGQDVFAIQPTGSAKSLIFQSAPIVFDTIRPLSNAKSIALVISPLASLMQDQVFRLRVYRRRTGKRTRQAVTSETHKLHFFQLRHRQGQQVTRPAVSLRGGSKTGPRRRRKSSLWFLVRSGFEPATSRTVVRRSTN